MSIRRIYISAPLAFNAVKFSKENCELDCMAFGLMIKMKYVNSIVNNPTIRNLKETFHIGQNRLKKILKYGLSNGYFHYDFKGRLISDYLHENKSYRINLDFDGNDFRLNKVKDMIRELVLTNQIKLQRDRNFRFAHNGESFRPKTSKNGSFKQQRQKRLTSMSDKKGMSLTSITKIMNVGRSKARTLRNETLSKGLLVRKFVLEKTDLKSDDFKRSANNFFKSSGLVGYLFHGVDGIYCQVQNIYVINYSIVKFKYLNH
jgi:hypothetical protein